MLSNPQPSLFHLFISFLRLGITAFGGPSMIAYIRKMTVEKKRWFDTETFNDGVALCQMIPGATAMQTAAYVGLRTRGVIGAAMSFIGFGLPAFLLMMIFAAVYTYTHDLPLVVSSFSGLQAIIVAIIANATVMFGKSALKGWRDVIIAGIAAILFGLNVNPVIVIILAAVIGLVLAKSKDVSQRHSMYLSSTTKPIIGILTVAAIGFVLLFVFQRPLFDMSILLSRIDLFAFGGGFASIPLMFHEFVDVRHWLDGPTFMNGIVLGQVTPGPIVITATFIGYLLFGVIGGVIATISIFLPSFVMVVGIAPYFDRLRASLHFNKVISGVLCSFVGLLFTIIFRFAWNVNWDTAHILLACGASAALLFKVDLLWVVGIGVALSMILFS